MHSTLPPQTNAVTRENITQIFDTMYPTQGILKNWRDRKIWIEFYDSYKSDNDRVIFFCVEGSPPKARGFMERYDNGWLITFRYLNEKATTKCFTFIFKKTTRVLLGSRGGGL